LIIERFRDGLRIVVAQQGAHFKSESVLVIGKRVLNDSSDWPASEMFTHQDAMTAAVIESARAGALRFADQGDYPPIDE